MLQIYSHGMKGEIQLYLKLDMATTPGFELDGTFIKQFGPSEMFGYLGVR